MFLLIDNSNTRTKFLFWRSGQELRQDQVEVVATKELLLGELPQSWLQWRGRIVIASVVPEVAKQVRQQCKLAQIHFVNAQSPLGVGIDFPHPEQIGADRLANAAAIAALFPQGAVALDFGTALTFDVVSLVEQKGLCYRGGVIAAGIEALTDYLHEKTALLPQVSLRDLRPPAALGKTTVAAMHSGVWHGYRGLLQGILSALRKELALPALPAVATGGYAALIVEGLEEVAVIDPLLTLSGLAEIAVRVEEGLEF